MIRKFELTKIVKQISLDYDLVGMGTKTKLDVLFVMLLLSRENKERLLL